jgi:hypothetical protein
MDHLVGTSLSANQLRRGGEGGCPPERGDDCNSVCDEYEVRSPLE